jgi:hypothetical protein
VNYTRGQLHPFSAFERIPVRYGEIRPALGTLCGVYPRPITLDTLGVWVIKCNPASTNLAPMIASGRAHEWWCVAANYRTRLMAAGQPVLFWVSGPRRRGVWGAGHLTGAAVPGERWKVPTDIALFDEPVLAEQLSVLPELEVFRSPQQANPSWVDLDAWSVIKAILPQT